MSTLESPERPAGIPERPAPDDRPWGALWAFAIAFAAVMLGAVALIAVTAIRAALTDLPEHQPGVFGVALHGTPPVITFVATMVQDLVLIGGSVLIAARALGGRLTGAHLGFKPTRPISAFGYVIAAYVLFVLVAALWTTLMNVTDRENVGVDLGTRDSTFAFVAAMFLVCVVAPLAEEIFFRGFLFGALRKRGLLIAAGVSGIAFGLAHVGGSPIGFIVPLALLGILLALLYERTGSLYPPIALHALNNSIAFGVGDGRAWAIPVSLAMAALVTAGLARAVGRTP